MKTMTTHEKVMLSMKVRAAGLEPNDYDLEQIAHNIRRRVEDRDESVAFATARALGVEPPDNCIEMRH
jgi:hypothetical protein